MLPRRKNLLEAFKKSDAAGAPSASAPARSLEGTARPAAPPSAASAGPLFDGLARSAGVGRQPAPALILIGLVLAFVLGFVLGRGSGGETQAEEKGALAPAGARPSPPANQPRAFQAPPGPEGSGAPPAADPAASARIEDSALFDPANLQTVIVASYSKTSEDLAWATYEHLREARLPVFPPVESRNLVIVLAGAAPTAAELRPTEAAVKALSRDGKKKDYADAYTVRIDTLIPRTTKQRPENP
jgi:hypothetical protein